MVKRRKSKEELAEELQTEYEQANVQARDEPSGENSDHDRERERERVDAANNDADAPVERSEREASGSGPGTGPGDFTALSDAQVEEVNELFNLINRSGYLTIGSYNVQSDGEGNVAVTLTTLTPSSGGAPDDLTGSGGS